MSVQSHLSQKNHVDVPGAIMLTGFAALFAFNQVVIKVSSDGFGPIFMAGLRSAGAFLFIFLYMQVRGISVVTPRSAWLGGWLLGMFFTLEFMALYVALDRTSVSRASILLYSMPIWLAIIGHFVLPDEKLTKRRVMGLSLAMLGVVIAVSDRTVGEYDLIGDVLALFGAMCWSGIALTVRLTAISSRSPELQLLWQLGVSAPIMLLVAWSGGDTVRDIVPVYFWGLGFQIVMIGCFGFLLWFWLLKRYSTSGVASFSFLTPVLAVFLGWMILDERIGLLTWTALVLVVLGLLMINRR